VPADIHAEMFATFRQPAWHSIGKVFHEPLDAEEATELAGMDYEILKIPHEIWHGDILIDTVYDLVRQPHKGEDPMYFGTVSESYETLSNMDIARLLNPLSAKFQIETVGALNDGKRVFWTFQTGTFAIKGEEIKGFILVTEGKDGRAGLKIVITPVRVVCQNTLTMGLKSGTIAAAISHSQSPTEALNFWADTLPRIEAAEMSSRKAMEQLANTKVTPEQVDHILEVAFPLPRTSSKASLKSNDLVYADLPDEFKADVDKASAHNEYYKTRAVNFRESAKGLYDIFNQEFPKTAQTAWAIANAVAEHEDHRRIAGESRGSAILGDRQRNKERAFSAAFQLAGVK
jgi:phage/plasmid-like protein (TIGR03299 family)